MADDETGGTQHIPLEKQTTEQLKRTGLRTAIKLGLALTGIVTAGGAGLVGFGVIGNQTPEPVVTASHASRDDLKALDDQLGEVRREFHEHELEHKDTTAELRLKLDRLKAKFETKHGR